MNKPNIEQKKQKKDHRDISKELDLYIITEKNGQGLPSLLSNFVFIRNKIQEFIRQKWNEYGFQEVITPIIGVSSLYKTSEHLKHYQEFMFPEMEKNKEKYFLRPMTCPHHCVIYENKPRSYKELPIKISENSNIFRYETSGSLKGLERVRSMEIADHHIFATEDQLKEEIKKNLLFIKEILQKLEIKIKKVVCSLRDHNNNAKYHSDIEMWNKAEKILIDTIKETKTEYEIKTDEAAFYGPKLDFEIETIDEKHCTLSTIQIDFFLPKKFKLNYINKNGKKQDLVIIHQSPIGTYQRCISLLTEQTQGKLPIWLVPCQLVILPINEEKTTIELCNLLYNISKSNNIRTEIWKNKTINYRLREIFKKKIPYYIIIGNEEVKTKKFSIIHSYEQTKINLTSQNFSNFSLKNNNNI